jgi:hypothetical protein
VQISPSRGGQKTPPYQAFVLTNLHGLFPSSTYSRSSGRIFLGLHKLPERGCLMYESVLGAVPVKESRRRSTLLSHPASGVRRSSVPFRSHHNYLSRSKCPRLLHCWISRFLRKKVDNLDFDASKSYVGCSRVHRNIPRPPLPRLLFCVRPPVRPWSWDS